MARERPRRTLFQRLTDKMRGSGTGMEDRNIVGDPGPYGKAPGRDRPQGVETDTPPTP